MAKQIIRKISDEDFKDIIKKSKNYTDAMRNCGCNNIGNPKTLKKRINELSLDISHFNSYNKKVHRAYTNEEVFVVNSTYKDRSKIKKRLMTDFGWEYKCNSCGLSEWSCRITENKLTKISLELEHKNGINNDHRIENLEFLCPNCHSMTSTYRGRNTYNDSESIVKSILNDIIDKIVLKCIDCDKSIGKGSERCNDCSRIKSRKIKDRPSLQKLEEDLKTNTYVFVGKKYNVSDNCIRKWIKQYKKEIV